MVRIEISNCLKITGAAQGTVSRLKNEYTVANPDYYKLERLGKWTGGTPQTLAIWQRDGDTLILPSGTLQGVLNIMREHGEHGTVKRRFKPSESVFYKSNISLYPYQENAVEAAQRAERGIIVAPCGSGKTQMGLELIARLGVKTLWLTHTHDLLAQSMERAKSCYDLDYREYGTITAGKVDIGNAITFATVQTMAKLNLEELREVWDCVVVDECHHVAGSPTKLMQFGKVVNALSARYKYGLSATLQRADGLIKCTKAYLGDVVFEVSQDAVKDTTCPVKYEFVDTGWDCDVDDVTNPDGTLNYVSLINAVCGDEKRNETIALTVYGELEDEPKNRVLILTERVIHAGAIYKELQKFGIKAVTVTGNTKKDLRETAISLLKSGEYQVMIATYQLAKEGLDIPELTHLILASPNKTDTVIIQAAGRVARKSAGKEFGTIIDFTDDFLTLQSWAKKRERIYKKLGYSHA